MAQATPSVYLTTAPKPAFQLIPDGLPRTLPAPANEHTLRAPFNINPWLYNVVLRPEIPFLFAAAYIVMVTIANNYNRRHGHKQTWWIARQSFFKHLVVAHNAFLTVFSAATFLAMGRAIAHTWPGWHNPNGLAGVADALCKLHGPRGLGDATTFNSTVNIWEVKNTMIKLGFDGNPDPTDVGRLWNEGLAFWGWWFYLSKFYEVVDTLIILAKGKRSPTLQTYHHSGAMLCMWAGIRYMSPPIWMFVFVNSFIHALMYTYYTLSALQVKVPVALKQILTTMQIAQILWGSSYALAHLFIQYDTPFSTPYQIEHTIQAAASSVASAASAASSTASKVIASPAASGTLAAVVKKLLLRAVGEEGVAERMTNSAGDWIAAEPIKEHIIKAEERASEKFFETRWHTDLTRVNCIDTTGEAYAIYLNLVYLYPLVFLFLRYFVKTYFRFSKPKTASEAAKQVVESGKDAEQKTEQRVDEIGLKLEEDAEHRVQQLRKDVQSFKEGSFSSSTRRVSDHVSNFERQIQSGVEKVKDQGKKLINGGSSSPRRLSPVKKRPETPSQQAVEKDESAIEEEPENLEAKTEGTSEEKPEQVSSEEEKDESEEGGGLLPQSPVKEKPSPVEVEAQREFSEEPINEQNHIPSDSSSTQDHAAESDDKENQPPTPDDAPVEPAAKQDANLVETQPTRPGLEEPTIDKSSPQLDNQAAEIEEKEDDEVDTDAMGKSGSIIDLVAEKAKDAAAEADS